MNRNDRPYADEDIASTLYHRFGRIFGQELTADKVKKAKAGHTLFRRQIELAGGGSLLPRISRHRVILGHISQAL